MENTTQRPFSFEIGQCVIRTNLNHLPAGRILERAFEHNGAERYRIQWNAGGPRTWINVKFLKAYN